LEEGYLKNKTSFVVQFLVNQSPFYSAQHLCSIWFSVVMSCENPRPSGEMK